MCDRYLKSDKNKKIIYIDADSSYRWAMGESLHFDENTFYKKLLGSILKTPDDSDIGYFVEVDLKYPDDIEESKVLQFLPWN